MADVSASVTVPGLADTHAHTGWTATETASGIGTQNSGVGWYLSRLSISILIVNQHFTFSKDELGIDLFCSCHTIYSPILKAEHP